MDTPRLPPPPPHQISDISSSSSSSAGDGDGDGGGGGDGDGGSDVLYHTCVVNKIQYGDRRTTIKIN